MVEMPSFTNDPSNTYSWSHFFFVVVMDSVLTCDLVFEVLLALLSKHQYVPHSANV